MKKFIDIESINECGYVKMKASNSMLGAIVMKTTNIRRSMARTMKSIILDMILTILLMWVIFYISSTIVQVIIAIIAFIFLIRTFFKVRELGDSNVLILSPSGFNDYSTAQALKDETVYWSDVDEVEVIEILGGKFKAICVTLKDEDTYLEEMTEWQRDQLACFQIFLNAQTKMTEYPPSFATVSFSELKRICNHLIIFK